jgi:predicted enzyme related to lactoylglutathione lyase
VERTYPPGVPCWIDLEPADPDAACRFYGTLLGWTFDDAVPPGGDEHYLIASLDGQTVGAIGMPGSGTWNTYIAVDDTDRVAAAGAAAGGQLVDPPVEAGPGGRRATLADPAGAQFRLWQPRARPGSQVANVPGAWNFSILHTTDPAGADAFYGSLFGWEADAMPGVDGAMWRRPGYGEHLAATVDPDIHERQAAGGAPAGFADVVAGRAPLGPGEQAHWHVTFTVTDRDDAVATALALGATDVSGPVDTMWTRTAVVRDPQGAVLTLSQFAPPA